MEKDYEFGPINGAAFNINEKQHFSLELSSSEAHYFYHADDKEFLEELDAVCETIYPDDWEELIDVALKEENKEILLSKIRHDGGGEYYHCYCDDEVSLIEFGTFLDDLLKDKNRFLKYIRKTREE
jgi:hypothetical protein